MISRFLENLYNTVLSIYIDVKMHPSEYFILLITKYVTVFDFITDRPWGPPSLLCNGYRVSFPAIKLPGRGVNRPPLSSAVVKERVELCLCFYSGSSWPVLE